MSNKQILNQYLEKLREYIKNLNSFTEYSFKEFDKNIQINWAINRGLQLAIECSIDIGEEIITGLNLPKPQAYKHAFQILARHQVIPYKLSKRMQRLAEFRNRLVHDYLFLDQEEIYNVLQRDLKYFEKYLLTIEKFVKDDKMARTS